MKILMINGGYNAEDPSTKVADLYEEVLKELHVEVSRIDLYKKMPQIQGLRIILEDIDGVVIVNTSKWVGIGAIMQQFLDNCYDAGEDIFKDKYCLIVALALNSGEDYALNHIVKSWMALSGLQPETLSGVIPSGEVIEKKESIRIVLEKKIEDFYRVVKGKRSYLPTSLNKTKTIITIKNEKQNEQSIVEPQMPQTEVESDLFSDNDKQDIVEITKLFKSKLKKVEENPTMSIIKQRLESTYSAITDVNDLTYSFSVKSIKPYNFSITIGDKLIIDEVKKDNANIQIAIDEKQLFHILDGQISLQNSFVLGKISVKGQMGLLNIFDQCFKL